MGRCKFCGKDAGFLRNVHEECKQANKEGTDRILEISSKAAVYQSDLSSLKENIYSIAAASFIDDQTLVNLLVRAWEDAVSLALEDDILSEDEENALGEFKDYFSLPIDTHEGNGVYAKVVKASIIRELLDGKIPQRISIEGALPFNFQKSETLVWLFQKTPYYEQRARTKYSGGYSGVSLRIAKGVYYRTGGFKGNPIVTTQNVLIDTGILGITTKHIYFAGSVKSFRIRYDKIVTFTPYSDGIAIQRDASSAKPQTFVTRDGWFSYNLITNLAQLSAV